MSETMRVVRLTPIDATAAAIAPFGTLIEPGADGTPFGTGDASLDLSRGTPRLYIMRLVNRGLTIRGITRHVRVTQCLAAMRGAEWLVALAPPHDVDVPGARPRIEDIVAFRIPGSAALALHRGTWHAGPYFVQPEVEFLNLELSDTNLTDHDTWRFDQEQGVVIELVA